MFPYTLVFFGIFPPLATSFLLLHKGVGEIELGLVVEFGDGLGAVGVLGEVAGGGKLGRLGVIMMFLGVLKNHVVVARASI